MTKTAQLAVARGLAETLTGTGVRVSSVLPRAHCVGGCRQFRVQSCESARRRSGHHRARVLRRREALISAAALRNTRRGGGDDHLCLRRASVSHHRRGVARRWWCRAIDRVRCVSKNELGMNIGFDPASPAHARAQVLRPAICQQWIGSLGSPKSQPHGHRVARHHQAVGRPRDRRAAPQAMILATVAQADRRVDLPASESELIGVDKV